MIAGLWQRVKRLPEMLTAPPFEPAERALRIITLQRNIILPARLVVIALVFYMLQTPWFTDVGQPAVVNESPAPAATKEGVSRDASGTDPDELHNAQRGGKDWIAKSLVERAISYGAVFETIQSTIVIYAFLIIGATVLASVVRHIPPAAVQWGVFIIGLADGVFLGGLTVLTGGFESPLYWVYPAVIVLNAISMPLATPQIILNLVLTILYLSAGLVEGNAHVEMTLLPITTQGKGSGSRKFTTSDIKDLPRVAAWLKECPEPLKKQLWESLPEATREKLSAPVKSGAEEESLKAELAGAWSGIFFPKRYFLSPPAAAAAEESQADPYVLRVAVLLLLTFCCYALQVLVAGQERAKAEQDEFSVRTGQLRAAGRLAAEFAHQIKNPLAIVNNVAFSLQKALKGEQREVSQQIGIIQEEVSKADLIITQIMGYAQLSEGRVEKLSPIEEMEKAIQQVFPPGTLTGIKVHRDYSGVFPPLLMQRRHFSEAVSNLLQNARDVLKNAGNIFIAARTLSDYSVEVVVRDDGAGIPPDKLERIFEAYYTTKDRGSGLGLAIVKHNVELYGGSVRVESELGKGAKFTLLFPAKSLIKLGK